jgi:hypothetical protein
MKVDYKSPCLLVQSIQTKTMNSEGIMKSVAPMRLTEPKLDNALDVLAKNSPETAVWEMPGDSVPST